MSPRSFLLGPCTQFPSSINSNSSDFHYRILDMLVLESNIMEPYNMHSTKQVLSVTLKETKPIQVTTITLLIVLFYIRGHVIFYFLQMFSLIVVCTLLQIMPYYFIFYIGIRVGIAK